MVRPLSWNKFIWEQTKGDQGRAALRLYLKMRDEGVVPDHHTFVAALMACAIIRNLEAGRRIHSHASGSGEMNITISNALLHMYTRCGSIEDALHVFEKMKHRDSVSWTSIITGYAHMNMWASALTFYDRMQNEGFAPDARTFMAALKACACLAIHAERGGHCEHVQTSYLEQGRAIHAEIAKRGLESDMFVASTLINMYVKCGSIEEARQVFEKMSHRDTVSWTAMIIGYAQMEMGASALELYACMRNEGFAPNAHTFTAVLKSCASLAAQKEDKGADGELLEASYLKQGRAIHAEIAQEGLASNIYVASTLVDMYAKCGSMEDARQVFEKMRQRNVVSWTAIIMGYAQRGEGALALELYARMLNEGFEPTSRTFVAALKACPNLATAQEGKGTDNEPLKPNYLEQGRAIHDEVRKRGLESDIFVASTLVDMYAKCRSIEEAQQVFRKIRHHNVVSWNALIIGYTQVGMGDLALKLYESMHREGLIPNARTYVAALMACSSLAAREEVKGAEGKLLKTSYLEQGRAIHTEVAKRGFESDIYVASTLVDMYAKCGSIEDACQVFEKMKHRDVVSWTAMIVAYAQMELGDLALELYARMRHEGFRPNAHTFVAVLNACASLAAQESKGADGEFVNLPYLDQGRAIHAEIVKRGFESDIFIANSLVDMYAKYGSIEDACKVFERMRNRDTVSWNAMITGYAQIGMGDLALELYVRMQHEGFTPSAHTFAAACQACGSLASLEAGKEVHCQIHSAGLQGQPFIANCVIDMYGKCGSMWDAQQLFDSLLVRNCVTWNALIAGYSGHGDNQSVFDLYNRMQQEGIMPDCVTFASVLNVCDHNGLVDKGQMYFQAMCLEYGIFPSYNHYSCMTDLLGRAGDLDEAAAMVMKMPFEPDTVTWITLLSACQKWNNVGAGRNTFECAVGLDEEFSAEHVTMTKIYLPGCGRRVLELRN